MAEPTPSGRQTPATKSVRAVGVEPDVSGSTTMSTMSHDIENYSAALKYLSERVNFERSRPAKIAPDSFKLDRMAALLNALDNPQNDVRCVHIAGSKGKGSTVEMVASGLTACGYATGVYTSPHLVDVRERIRINSEMIGYSAFTRLTSRVAAAAEQVAPVHGDATYFEVVTAIGLCYFAEQAVDMAVIEVGLGGRLDSTNLVNPEVTAITAIQLEHTQILGDTLAKIAREKAGIMKPGITTLTVPQAPEVLEVFREVAAERGATLEVLGTDVDFSMRFVASPELGPHVRISVGGGLGGGYEHMAVPLKGEHQAYNCGLALAILRKLRDRGYQTPERYVAQGLARTQIAGRMEIVPGTTRLLLDGAHTPDSIGALVKAIGAHIRYDSMVVIFGCSDDKDVRLMLGKLASGADKVIFTKASGTPRAMEPRELVKRYVEVSGKMAQYAGNLKEALEVARAAAGREDLICITGSFYLVGEARKMLADSPQAGRRPGR
jgi:dihydrofolate synthase / folylpolyglutamate synthase